MAGLLAMSSVPESHMALFERCWAQLDGSNIGQVNSMTAAAFLKKSQLKEPTLHKIWDLADAGGRGYLDKQGFFTALRLVAACQMGREPALSNILPMDPPPKFVGLESTKWTIEAAERTLYNNNFERLKPVNGLLSGDKVRPVLMKSQLPIDMLGKIWALSDIDRDGSLDADEFAVAMKLTTLIKQGEVLPLQLPTSLVPPAKAARLGLAPPTVTSTLTGPRPASPAQSDADWVITPDIKAKYDSYFVGIDKDHDGLVSGEEARGLFMASNLPQQVLAHIWNLCDTERSGKLNAEQFALAMYLMAERVRGREPPDKLPQHLIPPTKRRPTPQQQAPPSPLLSSSFDHPPSRDDKHTPSLFSSSSASDLGSSSSLLPPSTGLLQPTPSASNQASFMADFTAIKELDTISTDIETVKKEKAQLQADILQKQELVKQRKDEIATLHGELNSSSHQREQLEKQKNEAQTELDNIISEHDKVTSELATVKQQCEQEQIEIQALRDQLESRDKDMAQQKQELERQQQTLDKLKKEEQELKTGIEATKNELLRIQNNRQTMDRNITTMQDQIEQLRQDSQSLTVQLAQLPPPSSEYSGGSGPSELPAGLPPPNLLGETDAISARATAGSSSPVSSISGFSTASHQEEQNEERERTDTITTASNTSDPFSAFTTDAFSTPKGADTTTVGSGFDPFSAFRAPNVATTTPSSSSTSSTAATGFASFPAFTTPAAASSDPFAGSDPFGSDPFSTPPSTSQSSNKTTTTTMSTWSGVPGFTDPFSSTTSNAQDDPFSSSDPFSDNPFNTTPTSNSFSPFSSSAAQSSSSSGFGVDPFTSLSDPSHTSKS